MPSVLKKAESNLVETEDLKRIIKVCMFDQYGTVVDMQTGLTEIATPYLKAKGWTGNRYSFVTWWRRIHFENSMIDARLHKEHTPYREIGHRSVAFVLERAGILYTMEEVHALVAEIEKLRCFPEVPEALARLQTRYKLVVLSNGDPDMLETAEKHHGIRSIVSSPARKPIPSSRTWRPIQRRRSCSAFAWTRCCSSQTTHSIASARNRPACRPRSSIGADGRSVGHHTSPTSLCPR